MVCNPPGRLDLLDRQLSETDDPAEMAAIYLQAGQLYAETGEIDEACFFMTQAFVFAIDTGDKTLEQKAREFLSTHNRI